MNLNFIEYDFKFSPYLLSQALERLDTFIHVAVNLLSAHTHKCTHLTLGPPPDLMLALTFSL